MSRVTFVLVKLFSIPAVAWFPFEDCAANSNEAIIPFCSWTLAASLSSEPVLGLWFETVVTLCKLTEKKPRLLELTNLISSASH